MKRLAGVLSCESSGRFDPQLRERRIRRPIGIGVHAAIERRARGPVIRVILGPADHHGNAVPLLYCSRTATRNVCSYRHCRSLTAYCTSAAPTAYKPHEQSGAGGTCLGSWRHCATVSPRSHTVRSFSPMGLNSAGSSSHQ